MKRTGPSRDDEFSGEKNIWAAPPERQSEFVAEGRIGGGWSDNQELLCETSGALEDVPMELRIVSTLKPRLPLNADALLRLQAIDDHGSRRRWPFVSATEL